MKFQDIYNPKYVYEGFFETYFIRPFFHLYFQFKGHESSDSCLKSLFAWVIITLGVTGIMLGQIGIIGPDGGIILARIILWIWAGLSVIPIAALISRTTQGPPPKPLKAKMLGIDTMLGISCLLFFVLGLLMMITTLDSGELNPNARVVDETDTIPYEEEYVKEEPIFTYQDAEIQPIEEDTMKDVGFADIDEYEESFDPSITIPVELVTDTI